jgi:hypothetical protein
MIGIVENEFDSLVVAEFFELFKTEWGFVQPHTNYDVIITSGESDVRQDAALVIIYNSQRIPYDAGKNYTLQENKKTGLVTFFDAQLPLYCHSSTVMMEDTPISLDHTGTLMVRIEDDKNKTTVYRLGYDLFDEARHLLTQGQPPQHAHIPTLDIHIDILRTIILCSGLHVVEIPPTPAGYEIIGCLTHDVDFVNIRDHFFDHSFFGFCYRALITSAVDLVKGRISARKVLKNYLSVLSLPLVFAGILKDPWERSQHYVSLEKKYKSSFFFIPLKNSAGRNLNNDPSHWMRAAQYNITKVKNIIAYLKDNNKEIGLHGIDAWAAVESAAAEKKLLEKESGSSPAGTRMHWLYFSEKSHEILDKTGFAYDSTVGYNDSIGYRAGTAQAYRPLGISALLELPLHIQDVALFTPSFLNLTEKQALPVCLRLLETTKKYGGAITLLWHFNTIGPEKFWGNFYAALIKELEDMHAWISSADEVVDWYNKRRGAAFDIQSMSKDELCIRLHEGCSAATPPLKMRVYFPIHEGPGSPHTSVKRKQFADAAWNESGHVCIPLVELVQVKNFSSN